MMVGFLTILRHVAGIIDTNAVAHTSYDFWRSVGYDHDGACAWVGNAKGETSLDQLAVGDHGQAFGFGQDHADRCAVIKANAGIDLIEGVKNKTLTVEDALKAVDWESSHAIGTRHVREHVMATQGLRAKVSVIVHEYEFSKNQGSDVDKRTNYAQAVSDQALTEGWDKRWSPT